MSSDKTASDLARMVLDMLALGERHSGTKVDGDVTSQTKKHVFQQYRHARRMVKEAAERIVQNA